MSDPLMRVAIAQAFAISMELETQLMQTRGYRPVVAMLQLAKNEAASAMVALVNADPAATERIRALQNEAKRFSDLCAWAKQVIADGKEADDLLGEKDREELLDAIQESEAAEDEAVEAGLVTREGTYATE